MPELGGGRVGPFGGAAPWTGAPTAAAVREAMEELEIDIELGPLIGLYSRADERVVLAVYRATTGQVPQTTDEATEVRAFAPDELPWDELAFWSTELALKELQNGT